MSRIRYPTQIKQRIKQLIKECEALEAQVYKPNAPKNEAWFELRRQWDLKKGDLKANQSRLKYLNRENSIEEKVVIIDNKNKQV